MFLVEINIRVVGELGKADGPPQCRWASCNLMEAWIEHMVR